jgi:magnesium-transporting ATPase (P-type)
MTTRSDHLAKPPRFAQTVRRPPRSPARDSPYPTAYGHHINLARGAELMARHGVLVRHLNAIENLGSMDILCTDKTGTLTEGVVELEGAYDASGARADEVLVEHAGGARLVTKGAFAPVLRGLRPPSSSAPAGSSSRPSPSSSSRSWSGRSGRSTAAGPARCCSSRR